MRWSATLDARSLKTLRAENPDLYREEIARIESRALGVPAQPPTFPREKGWIRTADAMVEHMRKAFNLDDSKVTDLQMVRRNTVYACVKLRSEMIAALPLVGFKDGGGARSRTRRRIAAPFQMRTHEAEELHDHDLLTLLDRPNPDWTGLDVRRMTVMYGDLTGHAHWQLERGGNGAGRPTELSIVKPSRMSAIKAEADDEFRTLAGWWRDQNTPQAMKLAPSEVVWFRHADPNDPDYGALAPADVARLGADSYQEAMTANRNVFGRGLQADGMIVPPDEQGAFGWEQSDELERDINDKMRGARNAHAVPLMPYRLDFVPFANMSPHDAEFIALMEFAIEDVARAFGVPIEMVGGTRRTYQNNEAADAAFWGRTLEPLARWYASVITHQMVPMFEGIDYVAFDLSSVAALQEDETARWMRGKEQVSALVPILTSVAMGTITPEQAQAVIALSLDVTAEDAKAMVGDAPAPASEPEPITPEPEPERAHRLSIEYGSDAHRSIMERADKAKAKHEAAVEELAVRLFKRQGTSIADQVAAGVPIAKAFNRARWIREFRVAILPLLEAALVAGSDAVDLPGRSRGPLSAAAVNFLRGRAQRFATEVNETTWQRLKNSLAQGMDAGDAIPALADRVSDVMTQRASSAETIARTEVLSAYSRGGLIVAKESGLDLEKEWLAALDDRTRDAHADAHGQRVGLDEQFSVGGEMLDAPGDGSAENSVNCRCTLTYSRGGRSAALVAGDPSRQAGGLYGDS